MAFLNRDNSATLIKQAEDELNEALGNERPDELGAKLKDETPPGEPNTPEPEIVDGHNWQERYKNLQRYVQKVKDDNKKVIEDLTTTVNDLKSQLTDFVNKSKPASLPETDEDLEELRKTNPAAYNSLTRLAQGIANDIVEEQTRVLRKDMEAIKNGQKKNAKQAAYIELARRHPDLNLEELNVDEQFQTWIQSKSTKFQDAIFGDEMDVDAASDVLDLYKAAFPKKKAGARKLVNEDVPVSGNPPKIPKKGSKYEFSESQIDEMDRKDHTWTEKNLEKIEKAYREGRILMDISDPVGAQRALASEAA